MRINRFAAVVVAFFALTIATGLSNVQPLSLLPKTFSNGATTATDDRREPELSTQERITLLREKLQRTRDQARQAELAVAADTTPPGAEPLELSQGVQLLRRLTRTYQRQMDALTRLQQIQQSRRDLDTEPAKQLPEQAPYSIDVVDGLWADVLAKTVEIQTATVSLRRTETLYDTQRQTLQQAEQSLRQAQERMEAIGAEASDASERARWLRDLAEVRLHLAQASIAAQETDRQILVDTNDYQKRALSSLRDQAETVARTSPLSEADRDAKLAALGKVRESLRRQIQHAALNAQSALDAVQEMRNRLQEARNEAPADQLGSETVQSRLARLQARLEARRILSETAALELETARLSDDGVTLEESLWRQRYDALHPVRADVIKSSLATVRSYLDRVALGREQIQSQMNAALVLVDTQQKQVDSLLTSDPTRKFALDALNSYRKRIDMYQLLLSRGEELQGLLHRWELELELYRGALSTSEELIGFFQAVWDQTLHIWNYELFTAEDTIEVDGEIITGKRSITVSKVLTVLLLLTVGIWLAGRFARIVRWLLARRLSVNISTAILAYRLVYIFTVILLLVFALTAFKIPFTAFAFLGGALAIGIGFGAQNLLNNFISGLILLMERPINLGDIVEVEGVRGEVTSIGARYSEVKRFDGVDILIPNSTLLEKNVTNLTLSDKNVRVSVSVGVAYGSSTREVSRMIHHAVEDHGQVLHTPAPVVLFEEFGESSLVFTVYFWVALKLGADYRIIASDVRYRIDKLFRESGINLALPRREIHLDTSRAIPVEVVQNSSSEQQ